MIFMWILLGALFCSLVLTIASIIFEVKGWLDDDTT